jgi:hypothetical protein
LGPHLKGSVFEDRVITTIYGHKWEQMTQGWRKVDTEEANIMTNKLRTVRWAMNVAGMEERCIQEFGKISEAKRQLEHANSMMILKSDSG